MIQREREIGNRVRECRAKLRLSQRSFAEQIGLTRDQLAHIEYHRTPLRYDIAWRIRRIFGVSIDWLWGGCFGPMDVFEDDHLPLPDATGLPESALLTAVFEKVHGPTDGLDYEGTKQKRTRQVKLSKDDLDHRSLLLLSLRLQVREWIARVPTGHATDLHDKLMQLASAYLKALPEVQRELWEARHDALVWEELRRAVKERTSGAAGQIRGLTDSSEAPKSIHVQIKPQWPELKKRLQKATEGIGAKPALAKVLNVDPTQISQWLSESKSAREPGGDYALRLLKWVELQERGK